MKKLRVLEFTNHLGFGGTERTLYRFLRCLDRERFEVSVLAHSADKEAGWEELIRSTGVEVRLVSKQYLSKTIERLKADIFHIHRAGWEEPGPITAAKQAGVPVVIEHNVFGRIDQSEEGGLIDCHILISYSCAWRYQMWLRRPLVSPKYQVLYNPVDIDAFDRFGFENRDFNRKSVGRIGRADDTKWDADFLKALPRVAEAFPNFEFHVIGLTPAVRAFLRENNLEKNLVEHAMTTDENEIMRCYRQISVLTHFAEIGESFGIVLAEAMAAKLPIVTHTTGPLKDSAQTELVTEGLNGLVAVTPEMYAESVVYLLSHPDEARMLGMHGYAKARALYDAPALTRGLEEIFRTHAALKGLAT